MFFPTKFSIQPTNTYTQTSDLRSHYSNSRRCLISADDKMEPSIWSRLPSHLLDHILSFLPLKHFLNLRSTCKHFNSTLKSPLFLSKHALINSEIPNLPSLLILSHPQLHRHFPLLDATKSTWRRLALPSPSQLSCAGSLLSVSRGLLCFSLLPHSSSFLVSDLLATSSNKFIDFPIFGFNFDLVTLVCSRNGFRIFLLCSNSAFVYNSGTEKWRTFDVGVSILTGNCHQEGVFLNGLLYFVTPEPFSIVYFDLDTGDWGKPAISLPIELTFARLVSNGDDKLYLIGGIGQHGISRGIKIWELDEKNRRDWVEIESLPDLICKKFMSICYHNYEHVYCFWHQGLICVCCYNWPEVLYYKVSRMTWHWSPKNPSLPEKWSFGFRWFSLVPELHAFV